jgi:hypothetical protein
VASILRCLTNPGADRPNASFALCLTSQLAGDLLHYGFNKERALALGDIFEFDRYTTFPSSN